MIPKNHGKKPWENKYLNKEPWQINKKQEKMRILRTIPEDEPMEMTKEIYEAMEKERRKFGIPKENVTPIVISDDSSDDSSDDAESDKENVPLIVISDDSSDDEDSEEILEGSDKENVPPVVIVKSDDNNLI